MQDDNIETVDDRVGAPLPSRPTKRDLVERGLDVLPQTSALSIAGSIISFRNLTDVMDFARAMATSGKLIPQWMRGQAGSCLGITFQSIHWKMDPFQVAQKSYEVSDRVGFESQLIHAVIESRAPLQHRLDCSYVGEYVYEEIEKKDKEGNPYTVRRPDLKRSTRQCIVRGLFSNGDLREYESPEIRNIRVKNSTQWWDDPDQQLFYYASRAWARKWCPDVLMGAYTREELQLEPSYGREGEDLVPPPGLGQRLLAAGRGEAGHREGFAEEVLDSVENGTTAEAPGPLHSSGAPAGAATPAAGEKRTRGRPKGSGKKKEADTAGVSRETKLPGQIDLEDSLKGG